MYTIALALLLSARSLAADAEPFSPASSLGLGSGTLQGEAPVLGRAGPSFGVGVSAAHNLVVYSHADGTQSPILGEVLSTELSGGYTFGSRLRVDASVPLYLNADAPWAAYDGAAAGDASLQATIPIFGEPDSALALAVVPHVGLPTGTRAAFLGRGPSAGATAAVGGVVRRVGWLGNVAFTWSRPDEIEGVTMGSTLDALGGAWWNVGEGVRVGAESDLSYGLASALTGTRNTFASGHVFTQVTRPNGVGLVAGLGRGLIGGVGAPEYRVFASVTFARVGRDLDQDLRGDNGSDVVVSAVEECLVVAVPTEPQVVPDVDTDGDGLSDLVDSCPAQARPADEPTWASDGCPKRTWFAGTHVATLDAVAFGDSHDLAGGEQVSLDAIAAILKDKPWLVRLEVGVHVDDRGGEGVSMAFSQLRADAIVTYLVGQGVAPERLIAMGYGDVSPVDTNRTEEGREHNRRVVFTVREQRPPSL